jgi:sugar/nucleoside kinase (ribokinase family)
VIEYVTFGIIIDDMVYSNGHTQMGVLGGGGAQTAWGMAVALGSGERVGLVAGVGDDLTESMLAPLKTAGINLDGLRVTKLPTPRAWQITEADGRRTQVWRTPTAILGKQLAKEWDYLPKAYHAAEYFHWGFHLEDGVPLLAYDLTQHGKRVSLESFRVPSRVLSPQERRAIFESCFIFSAAQAEFAAMMGSDDLIWGAAGEFRQAGGSYLVVRQGKHGATAIDCRAQLSFHVPAIQTQVVDETGAGNAFCGAFLARIEDGCAEALCHGVVAASYLIEQVGLPPHLPDPVDYGRRMESARHQVSSKSLGA